MTWSCTAIIGFCAARTNREAFTGTSFAESPPVLLITIHATHPKDLFWYFACCRSLHATNAAVQATNKHNNEAHVGIFIPQTHADEGVIYNSLAIV